MKLFTVIPTNRKTNRVLPPRYDLRPMNHAAACNFARACTNENTSYRLQPWPADVSQPGPPLTANGYAADNDK